MKVRSLDDKRWDAALDLLVEGRGTVHLGELVSITWWTHGVGARPEVRVDIWSNGDPRFIPHARREQEIRDGLDLVTRAAETHPRLRRLIDTTDVITRYAYDYGKGSVRIADIEPGGVITWSESLEGVEYGDTLDE